MKLFSMAASTKTFSTVLVGALLLCGVSTAQESAPVKIDLAKGKKLYQTTCFACHGTNGKGVVPGTPNFIRKKGSLSKTDKVLAKNIWEGYRSPGSPLAMPPKGGNPKLTKDDITHILGYMRKNFSKK